LGAAAWCKHAAASTLRPNEIRHLGATGNTRRFIFVLVRFVCTRESGHSANGGRHDLDGSDLGLSDGDRGLEARAPFARGVRRDSDDRCAGLGFGGARSGAWRLSCEFDVSQHSIDSD